MGYQEEKQRQLDIRYLKMATVWAENSYCVRRQVGALIVKNKMIISDGYNGTPSGFENVCDKLRDMNIDRIAAGTKQGISLKNELSNYNNSLRNVREVLLDNEQYKDCFLYRKLRQDIERYVSKLTQGSRRRYPDFSRNTQTP